MFKALPYDWSRDFTPVGPMATFDFVLFVHKDSPLKTVKDVIAAANANPDKFNFGSIAVGTAQNLSTLNFVSMAGLHVPTVPFRTTGEVVTGLDLRQHPGGVRDHPRRDRPDQGRQPAGDRGVVEQAGGVPARCADHRRKRAAGLLDLFLERHGAAGQDPARRR